MMTKIKLLLALEILPKKFKLKEDIKIVGTFEPKFKLSKGTYTYQSSSIGNKYSVYRFLKRDVGIGPAEFKQLKDIIEILE